MEEKQIVISIDDERAKYISEVIANKSCKIILDYLCENDATVSDIARELKMPINTVDYNIKKLLMSGLINKKSFWWSTKGKKMPIYTVSNKKIVISPRPKKSYIKYIYTLIITGFISLILKFISLNKVTTPTFENDFGQNNNIVSGASKVVENNISLALEKSGNIPSSPIITNNISSFYGIEFWMWFFIGSLISIFIFLMTNLINDWRNK